MVLGFFETASGCSWRRGVPMTTRPVKRFIIAGARLTIF